MISKLKNFFKKQNALEQFGLSEVDIINGYLAMNNDDILKLLSTKRDFYRDRCANYLLPEDQHYYKAFNNLIANIAKTVNEINKKPAKNKVPGLNIRESYNEKASGII